jgi:exopolysaccharide biosynthesis polyprenyl glycosylphosphotransferase
MSQRQPGTGLWEANDRRTLDLLELPPVERDQMSLGLVIDLTSTEPQLELIHSRPIHHRIHRAPAWQRGLKRSIDIVGSLVLLVLLSPLFLITSLAIALTSRGPILFSQERVGYMGRRFRFLKFRSMCHDAEERKGELLELNHHDYGPIFKVRDDPRMTPVGKLIRRLSIDELPQLFHVLTGDMSLVGPRPPLPDEVATYGRREALRLTVKPGMTCIWQVSGRSELDFDTWVDMDLEYIRSWSLWLDLKLLFRTVPAVVSGRGAY